jgi:hypothetical protein
MFHVCRGWGGTRHYSDRHIKPKTAETVFLLSLLNLETSKCLFM